MNHVAPPEGGSRAQVETGSRGSRVAATGGDTAAKVRMEGGRHSWRGCSLDDNKCLTLQQILRSFTAPISEEHAWAVIYQVLCYCQGEIVPSSLFFASNYPSLPLGAESRDKTNFHVNNSGRPLYNWPRLLRYSGLAPLFKCRC